MTSTGTARFVATPTHLRRIVTGRARTFTGYYPSGKPGNDHRLVGYQSLLERDFIHLVEDDRSVVSYQEQEAPVTWKDADGRHLYWPDFGLLTDTGRRVCIEVKPLDVMRRRGLAEVFALVGEFAVASGRFDDFQVWTDREIRSGTRLRIAVLRNGGRNAVGFESEKLAVRQALHEADGVASVADLRRASGLGQRGFRAVLGLLAEGSCSLRDPACLIEDRSVVVWRSSWE